MHIRTKLDGGKQINRVRAGSWVGRCDQDKIWMVTGALKHGKKLPILKLTWSFKRFLRIEFIS